MSNFIEIGGLIKKGLSHSIVERFSKNIDVISIGYANGRSSDLFDIQQFGDASEAEILTMIVKERKSNIIFDELYKFLKLSSENNGVIYKYDPISKIRM
tara:strand:+ start:207 stop:503 length:297 start_codon:yes stop_codon:yes gene_type:complete